MMSEGDPDIICLQELDHYEVYIYILYIYIYILYNIIIGCKRKVG